MCDMMLYVAMMAPENDLFYQNEESHDWQLLLKHYSLIVRSLKLV